MFENQLYEELMSKQGVLLVEGESKKLGKIIIPTPFFESYHNGVSVQISSSLQNRIKRIVTMYSSIKEEDFLSSLNKIKPYIKKEYFEEILTEWKKRDCEKIAEILLEKYYDRVYRQKPCKYQISSDDLTKAIEEIEEIRSEILRQI